MVSRRKRFAFHVTPISCTSDIQLSNACVYHQCRAQTDGYNHLNQMFLQLSSQDTDRSLVVPICPQRFGLVFPATGVDDGKSSEFAHFGANSTVKKSHEQRLKVCLIEFSMDKLKHRLISVRHLTTEGILGENAEHKCVSLTMPSLACTIRMLSTFEQQALLMAARACSTPVHL